MKRSPLPIAPTLPGVPCTYRVKVRHDEKWLPGSVVEAMTYFGTRYLRVRTEAGELVWRNENSVRVEEPT